MPKTIAVIDGNSLMHRAFHAVPPTMNAPDGTPTNAAFGFLSMLFKFIDDATPDVVICAFDSGRPKFRMESLKAYKAQRPPMDPDLKSQFPIIERLLEALDIPVIKLPGWEGDDILGTIAARDEELGFETLLVTGDKDAYQLASEHTRIVTTKKGISDVVVYGPDEVFERYGVRPNQVPDFLGLKGDPSDNIPGVPGIGEKTAAKLLEKYESIEGIYEHIDELKGKQRTNIEEHKDDAFTSRKVATIVKDVQFELDLESLSFPSFEAVAVQDAFAKVRFSSHLAKALSYLNKQNNPAEDTISWKPLVFGESAEKLLVSARKRGETLGVFCVSGLRETLFDDGDILAVATSEGTAVFEGDCVPDVLADIVKTCSFASEDVKALLKCVFPTDSAKEAHISEDDLLSMRAFDEGIAGYLLNSSMSDLSVSSLMSEYGNIILPAPLDDSREQAALCASALRMLEPILSDALAEDGSMNVFQDIDMPLSPVLSMLERTGMRIDATHLQEIGTTVKERISSLQKEIYALSGEEFNIDSPKQLSRILFEVLGLKPGKKTQRGYSTDASVLKDLVSSHEVPGLVLSYRELSKLASTYIDALPKMCLADGRIHSTFNLTVTTTGRLSSSEPNLQNIPVRTQLGRNIRECFIPDSEDHVFLSADYSQIELRLLAHLSQDAKLQEAFVSGADFHAATASHVFDVPVEDVTPELRGKAKAVNFGIVYGQQAFGLSKSLGISMFEAKDMIDRYFSTYPRVRDYLDETIAFAREHGFAITMFGRKRHIPELKARVAQQRSFGERTAMNHPMQGSAADIIKIAMRCVQEKLRESDIRARMLLQVHDELDFSVHRDDAERLSALVRDAMEHVAELDVPLAVDVACGPTWAEAH